MGSDPIDPRSAELPHGSLLEYAVVARIFLERRDMDDDLRGLFNRPDDSGEGAGARIRVRAD